MSTGFATAFSEITLVLFTTLAPSGAVAYALMSLPIIRGRLSDDAHRRIDKALCIPLIVSLVGLVASATHLGNPANALYVFMGVGRSPLSNEVFSAVIFLAFSGVYWLYSFAVKPRRLLQRLLAVGACVSAIACITAIAFAYSADTIITWNTPFSPLSLWVNALLGGPVLAIVGLRAARWKSRGNRFGRCSGDSRRANGARPRAIFHDLRLACGGRALERRSVGSKPLSEVRLPRPREASACKGGSSLRRAPRPLRSGWPRRLSTSRCAWTHRNRGFLRESGRGSAGKSQARPAARSLRSSSVLAGYVLFAMRAGWPSSSMMLDILSDGPSKDSLEAAWLMKIYHREPSFER